MTRFTAKRSRLWRTTGQRPRWMRTAIRSWSAPAVWRANWKICRMTSRRSRMRWRRLRKISRATAGRRLTWMRQRRLSRRLPRQSARSSPRSIKQKRFTAYTMRLTKTRRRRQPIRLRSMQTTPSSAIARMPTGRKPIWRRMRPAIRLLSERA